jgi:4-amino-4-deoxy-L-arabinose transferase-like glycosyltransferase
MLTTTSAPGSSLARRLLSSHAFNEREWWALAIVLIAFALRLFALSTQATIEWEGTEYAGIARNLLEGKGYYGLMIPGKELMFPPLFPFLIAATSLMTGDLELAARLVSMVMGSLLVVPVFLIAKHVSERRVAYLAAILVALHPLLVRFSVTTYSETTYITLLLTAMSWTLQAFRSGTRRSYAAAGVFYGLAYLTRPEAVACALLAFVIAIVYEFVAHPRRLGLGRLSPVLMPVALLVFAAPYVIWLHSETGTWRLEGKSALNYSASRAIVAGVPTYQALFGVDDNLTETGVFNQSNASAARSTRLVPSEVWRFLLAKRSEVLEYLRETVINAAMIGSPPLFMLVVLGLFRKPWDRDIAVAQSFLVLSLLLAGSALFFMFYLAPRFVIQFIPIMIVWAAGGVWSLAEWFEASVRLIGGKMLRSSLRLSAVFIVAAVVPLVALTAGGDYWDINLFGADSRPIRVAAEWLNRYESGSKTMVDTSSALAFYTDATFVPYPYASSQVALRYLDKRHVRFVVLKDEVLWSRPYLNDWMTNGIPSARATLIYNVQTPHMGRIKIYEWHPLDSSALQTQSQALSSGHGPS